MADYSKEFYESEEMSLPGDFSILEEFSQLKPGESIYEICEGFGITQILNIDSECWVVYDSKLIKFNEFLHGYFNNNL